MYTDVAYVDDDTKKEMRTNSQSHYKPAQVLLCVIRNVTKVHVAGTIRDLGL